MEITININPIIWQWGTFQLSWHSIASLVAIIVAIVIATKVARKKGIAVNEIYSLAPWVLVGGIIGARLFHVFDHWGYYSANPLQILMVQEGGLAIWGALIGGAVAVVAYVKIRHLPLALFLDVLVPALLVAQIIGRIGCTINGDAWGSPTNLPWGFIYLNSGASIPANLLGIPTHPYPVYEMIWSGLILLLLLKLRPHFKTDGFMFLTYLLLYSLGRLIMTPLRQENVLFWGLQEAQVVALIIMILTIAIIGFMFWLTKQRKLKQSADS
jgi:phosphatidylglycerol---prolipoprotein diacylglyceryl transferase